MALLATAFIGIVPQLNPQAFVTAGKKAGAAAGAGAGTGFAGGFNKNTKGLFKNMAVQFTSLANLLVPVGIAVAIAKIGQIGIAYEDNLNIFRVVTKATGQQMDQVAQKARELGADITLPGVSAAGAAAAMTELSKAGFSVKQSMDAARATLQLARISEISEADAAVIAANAVNAFGIAAKDTTFVVDELASAANSSSVDIHDVELAFRQASAVFSGFQAPVVGSKEAITELNTSIAILGNNGIRGSDAGTSLKQMLLQLTGPTERAKVVMEELALRAAGANVSLEDQASIIKGSKKVRDETLKSIRDGNKAIGDQGDVAYTASGKMRPLTEIIDLVTRGTKGMTQENRNAAITQIFGADATRSIIALMKGGLPTYEAMRKAVLRQGAAAEVAKAKNAGLKGSLDNIRSQLENIAIELYNLVKGPLRDAFNGLALVLQGLPKTIRSVADSIRANAGVFEYLGTTIAIAVSALLVYKTTILAVAAATRAWLAIQSIIAFVQLAREVRSFAAAWALLDAAMVANPIGIVVVAIAALVAGLIYAYRHSETFRKIVDAVGRALKTAFVASINFITGTLFPSLIRAFDQAKAATLFLYHNVILPVWNAIKTAVGAAVGAVRASISGIVTAFNAVRSAWGAVVNFLRPAINVVIKSFQVWRLVVLVAIYAVVGIIKTGLNFWIGVFQKVWTYAFAYVRARVTEWWTGVKVVFNLFRQYVIGPLVAAAKYTAAQFVHTYDQIKNALTSLYRYTIKPTLDLIRIGWRLLGDFISFHWNRFIKPIFLAFVSVMKNQVVGGFKTAVRLIGQAWDGLKEQAKKPIKFVVNSVLNPFIGGLNKAADIVGVPKKYRVTPIQLGFATGGLMPAFAQGGRIAGAPSFTDNRMAPATIPGVGAVKLAGGEFIVNARDTAKALPVLRWINDGMKGGADKVASYIGRPLTDMPGDGSEGWAFKGGGLVGWVKDIWGALSNPASLIKKPVDALLGQIPGGNFMKSFLGGAVKRMVDGAISWLTGMGGEGSSIPLTGRLGAAAAFLRAQNGKPYVWNSAGPGGYDCSGIVSAVYNILNGRGPFSHTFSTGSLPGRWFREGQRTGPLLAGWSHPGQSPASSSTGHMAGQLAGLPFESSGSRGVHLGSSARSVSQFAHIGAARFADGGLFGNKIRLFDRGGSWASGTIGVNRSGHTEQVLTGGPNGEMATLRRSVDEMVTELREIRRSVNRVPEGVGQHVNRAVRSVDPAIGASASLYARSSW